MNNKMEQELLELVKQNIDDPIKMISFLEHQVDMQNFIINLLIEVLETNGFEMPAELELVRALHEGFLKQSSVDFNDLDNPLQSYKLPKAIEKKERTRITQDMYLKKKIDNGIF